MSIKYIRYRDKLDNSVGFARLGTDDLTKLSGPPWAKTEEQSTEPLTGDRFELLAPVQPSKIICIGLNYHAHVKASYSADEAPERPLIFLKPPSSIIGPGDLIHHPKESERVDYEAELGVVIGQATKNCLLDEAMDAVFGYTCVNDVTARDLQKKDGQWSRAKGYDTFCPVGPWIITGIDYSDLLVEGVLNGEVKQSGSTAQMIFPIPFLISYLSGIMTLMPGDLISTGTPAGIAPMVSGDVIEVRVSQIGTLRNSIA
ncbi:MAG: fumarylacetoacetate hydrolase family protein [bacterium]|nr:fumarylacetoacetate hydrolase family protein [bacterium]